MKREFSIVAACLLGIGCSHASPKTEGPAVTAPSRAAHPSQSDHSTVAVETATEAPTKAPNRSIYFDFDSANLRSDAGPVLQAVGRRLAHDHGSIRIEGNCDERGTTEYNIALGDRRARQAQAYLERLGVDAKQISIVSYGSERPKDPGHDERAWAKNRRDDLRIR
jgi:peptidoglycan-associated lipoprotein